MINYTSLFNFGPGFFQLYWVKRSYIQIFPKKKLRGNNPKFQYPHSWVCERFIYIYSQDRSAYSAAGKYVDRSWEYVIGSQTHECGKWVWGRAIPRKGINKWDFRVETCLSDKIYFQLLCTINEASECRLCLGQCCTIKLQKFANFRDSMRNGRRQFIHGFNFQIQISPWISTLFKKILVAKKYSKGL